MPQTLTYKILESHRVEGTLTPGEPIAIRIDQTLTQDATGTMAFLELESLGLEQVKTDLTVSYVDHNMSQLGPNNQNDHRYLQTIAAKTGVFFSRPGNGICHQVHLERFGAPGKTLLGSDSHTPTSGGLGMLAIGAGGLDVAIATAGGPFRLTAPKVVGVKLTGRLPEWVAAKDVIFKVLSILSTKGNVGCVLEYFGPGVDTLSVPERATITNMGAEVGATTSVFPSDQSTRRYLEAQDRARVWQPIAPDQGAEYDRLIEIDLDELEPLTATPGSPDNIVTIRSCAGTKVGQVLVGSCTNSSLRDLTIVASILKGQTIHPDVGFGVAPGSRQVLKMITESGALGDLIAAGARILECGCGPCIGQGNSPGSGVVSLRTFNRNFTGRSGTKDDLVYLVSPEVAATSALTGEITDPREAGIAYPAFAWPDRFQVDDSMIIPPRADSDAVEIQRAETIGQPPHNEPLPETLAGSVLIKVGDKITTDHIMPAGQHLKHRSNIPEYAKVVFEALNVEGQPTFAERAAAARDAGKHGFIVARDSYGQGSSREHAAICPMYLGVKAVLALAIERIHAANLVNFGIVPLLFDDPADYDTIGAEDELTIQNVRGQLQAGGPVEVRNVTGGTTLCCRHALTDEDIAILLAGGRLNHLKNV